MSSQIYTYDAKFNWKTEADHKATPGGKLLYTKEDIAPELYVNVETIAVEEFSNEFAKIGRWYRVDSVTTSITRFSYEMRGDWPPVPHYFIEGETVVVVETDIAPDETHSITLAIAAILSAIAAAMAAHTTLSMIIIFVTAWAILGVFFKLTGTSIWTPVAPRGGYEWIIAIVIIAVVVLAIWMKKT